ncbi:hypothetical protein RJ639_033429 [Escallonia herrerae]|uniref:Protein kinase domain-containing protein n=1 Tax=Escallonia herrerae TaxID=1293975 RepID=A0AA88WWX3_9ASTE|nr:hypothetical protein RJ639_033429 [Escallonia herrerae]
MSLRCPSAALPSSSPSFPPSLSHSMSSSSGRSSPGAKSNKNKINKAPSGDIAILKEYMDGGTLDNLVKTNGSFSEAMIANIARQGLMGLDYIHEKKIVRQDFKQSNLLVSQKKEVNIADFLR